MKLRIFKADKGDALLVSSGNGKNHVMVDGGMGGAYREHCARTISKLKKLDVVYVSHIDRDHVQGIHQMLDDTVAWKVHGFLKVHGHPAHKAPRHPKPPPITKFWQNNFRDQVDDNDGEISDMLASQAFTLSGHESAAVREIALDQQELGQSVGDALRVSWRIAKDQLAIPVNPEAGHTLISASDGSPATFGVGKMEFTVIGPSENELEALRDEWNVWLEEKKAHKERLKRKSDEDHSPLVASSAAGFAAPLVSNAEELASSDERIQAALAQLAQAKVLGRRRSVTTPNLASLMFFAREGQQTMLLTGDGHCDDILQGLDNMGLLRPDGTLHVDVLKVPHHGSEHNTSLAFAKAITADKYVFCGNGAHQNPDLDVVKAYINARIGTASERSSNPEAKRRFRLVFNYHPDNETGARRTHLRKILGHVEARKAASSKISSTFIKGSSQVFSV